MRARTSKQALPDESFAQEELDILLRPFASWQSLKEHHYFLGRSSVDRSAYEGRGFKEAAAYLEVHLHKSV